jgi:hypothetical protein
MSKGNHSQDVRFEVLASLTMKCTFWDVTPCIPVEVSEERTVSIFTEATSK